MGSRLYTFHDSLFLAQFSCDIIIGCLPDSPSRSLQLFSGHVPESEKREATEERRELDLASSFYQGVHVERRKEENGGFNSRNIRMDSRISEWNQRVQRFMKSVLHHNKPAEQQ